MNLKALLAAFFYLFFFHSILISQPDVIFFNGEIITMEGTEKVEAIAITGKKIVALGTNSSVLGIAGQSTQIIDLEKRAIIPSFVDPHIHLFQNAISENTSLQDVQDLLFSHGITSVGEAFIDNNTISALREYSQSGELKVNIDMYMPYNNNCNETIGTWFLEFPSEIDKDQTLRVGGVKVFTDGGTCGLIPAISFEYPSGGKGDLFYNKEELIEVYKIINKNNYPILTHAQGDSAIEISLQAYDATLEGNPNILRHRLDHASFNRPSFITEYGRIGIIPVVFGGSQPVLKLITKLYQIFMERNILIG